MSQSILLYFAFYKRRAMLRVKRYFEKIISSQYQSPSNDANCSDSFLGTQPRPINDYAIILHSSPANLTLHC